MKDSAAMPTEFVQLGIGDGITVDASVTKPKDFQPTKKYPVFVYYVSAETKRQQAG